MLRCIVPLSSSACSLLLSAGRSPRIIHVLMTSHCFNVVTPQTTASLEPVKSVDDFVPEEAIDASFLEDTKETKGNTKQTNLEEESDR